MASESRIGFGTQSHYDEDDWPKGASGLKDKFSSPKLPRRALTVDIFLRQRGMAFSEMLPFLSLRLKEMTIFRMG
jgi:hypothetical protein